MDYQNTIMWKEINETPRIFGEIQQCNCQVMKDLVTTVKASNVTNFVAAARGTSDHALIFLSML